MNKIMNVLTHLLNWIVNIILLAGLAILLAWILWDVPPQVSLEKSATFFSNGWHLITGKDKTPKEKPEVTFKQLENSSKHTIHISK